MLKKKKKSIERLRLYSSRTSLVAQWLGLGAFTAVAPGSIPGQGTKIPPARKRQGVGGRLHSSNHTHAKQQLHVISFLPHNKCYQESDNSMPFYK